MPDSVTPRQEDLQAFRALFFEDDAQPLTALENRRDTEGYSVLTAAALIELSRAQLGEDAGWDKVVRWVADARAVFEESMANLDPILAEQILWVALGHDAGLSSRLDKEKSEAQFLVLSALLIQADIPKDQVATFLSRVWERGTRLAGLS